nr:hypothetical protein [Tanacetum cinerariifolium]
ADVVDVYDIDPEFVPTLNEHKYWVPNVPVDEKPKIDTVFNTFDDAYDMYKEYAVKARFSIRKSGLKRKEDSNDDGKENENKDGKKTRRSASTLTDCKARIGLKGIVGTNTFKVFDFMENHNHPLIDASNMDLSRARYQDGALRKAILQVFTQSHHRLCMWHIMQKLPAKVLGDVDVDSDLRNDFHKFVWNVYITPSVFQERWHAFIQKYNLSEKKWLSDMYEIRDRCVPGYFSEVPLCAMEKQRYTQRVLDNENAEKTSIMLTKLPIEGHACAIGSRSVRGVEECIIRQRDKRRNIVVESKVSHNQEDGSFECSCGHYNRHGFLCRHVLYVFGTLGMDNIPKNYISRRWRKNPLPYHLRDRRHRNDPDKLKVFLAAIKKERMNQKVPFKHRECSKCGQIFHNKCTCDEKRLSDEEYQAFLKKKKDVGEVDVNESDEDEEDVEVDDVDEDDGTDKHDEDEDND